MSRAVSSQQPRSSLTLCINHVFADRNSQKYIPCISISYVHHVLCSSSDSTASAVLWLLVSAGNEALASLPPLKSIDNGRPREVGEHVGQSAVSSLQVLADSRGDLLLCRRTCTPSRHLVDPLAHGAASRGGRRRLVVLGHDRAWRRWNVESRPGGE